MADEIKPTLDEEPEGESSGAKEQQSVQIDVDAVMKELEAIGKTKPEDVRNMHQASVQTGRYANEIGQLRQEIQRLRSEREVPQRRQDYGEYDNQDPIDLSQVIRKEVKGVYQEIQQEQWDSYNRQMQQINKVRSNDYYDLVGDVFEKHIQNPDTQMRISSGQTTYEDEFHRVKDKYLITALQRSRDALGSLKGGKKAAPHVESGASPAPVKEPDEDNPKARARKVAAKSTGSDDDLDLMIDAMLPKGDPLLSV